MNNRRVLSGEEIRQIQLEMLAEISRFCEIHEIRYGLSCGTLIGAVRHKGFIPWDDDIDLSMPRPDYDRFCETYCADFSEVHNYRNDAAFFYPYAKVYSKRVEGYERGFQNTPSSVYIDVFPVDGLPSSETGYRRLLFCRMFLGNILILRNLPFFRRGRPLRKQLVILFTSPIRLFPNRFYHSILDRLFRKVQFETSEMAGCAIATVSSPKNRMATSLYCEYAPVEFEGRLYPAFRDYDTYLRTLYGDYMTPPPVDARESPHHLCVWWKESSSD